MVLELCYSRGRYMPNINGIGEFLSVGVTATLRARRAAASLLIDCWTMAIALALSRRVCDHRHP